MNLVQRSLEAGDLGRARALLDRYRPKTTAEMDLRGWEWRYLWGLCRSDDHYALTQGSDGFLNLALAPNGKWLAARKWSGEIELWDLTTRRCSATFSNRFSGSMDFTPDGRFLVSAGLDTNGKPVVTFWEVSTRQVVRNLSQPSAVASLALSPDGRQLATVHIQKEPRVRLLEVSSGRLLLEIPTIESFVGTTPVPLFSPDGTTLALGETSGQIRLLNLAKGATNAIPVPVEGVGVCALAFSPDGSLLASAYAWSDATIYLWDVVTGHALGRLEGHRSFVERLVFAPDGQTLYSACFDQSIGVWDVPHQKQIGRLQGHVGRVAGLVLSPDARTLISSAYDGSIHLWDLPAKVRPPAKVVLPVRIGVYGSVFTADSRRLITASRTEPITVWVVGTTNAIEQISALGTNNQSVALSPDDGLLAVGGCDGTIKVWDLQNQRLVKQWRPYGPFPILVTEFLDGGKSLLSGAMPPGWLTEWRRWEVGSWKELSFGSMDLETCFGLAQSPDQQFFATTYEGRPVKIWEAASGRLKATLGFLGGFTPVFSPDGHLVAAALRDAGTQVWEVGSGRRVAVLQELAAPTQSAAFSPDGKRVAAGSWGMREATLTVHIWDYLVERELLSLDSQDRSTGWIQFSPDGNTLLAVSWHGLAELWHAPSWAEIEAAETRESVP